MPSPSLPAFNITCDFWVSGDNPPAAPDATANCQLYFHSKCDDPLVKAGNAGFTPPLFVRAPLTLFTDLGGVVPMVGGYVRLKDNFGNSWYYLIQWWDWTHRGFPNEYISFLVMQCGIDGTIPDPLR